MRALVGWALVATLTSCANSMPIQAAYDQARKNAEDCGQNVGFDPKGDFSGFERRLAPHEEAYWQCVHEGVERYVLPATRIPTQYRIALTDNRRWVAMLGRGEMTREDWKARLSLRIAALEEQERKLYRDEQLAKLQASQAASDAEWQKINDRSQRIFSPLPTPR